MKKFRFILSLLLVFVFVSTPVLAGNNIVVYMDGEEHKVREVPVVMNGQSIYSDVPTFIHNSSTLVPLRFVAEYYGSEVDWDAKTNSAIVRHGDKNIVMTIDQEEVFVNGESLVIANNATPKLVKVSGPNANTMVPLRFVSEVLGYHVDYDEEKGIPIINSEAPVEEEIQDGISEIKLIKGSTELSKLNIKSTKEMDVSHKKDGNKVSLTIKNTSLLDKNLDTSKLNSHPIKNVSVKEVGNNVEINFELTDNYNYDFKAFDSAREFTISPVSRVGEIKKEIVDGEESIVIYKEKKTDIKRTSLNNPRRFVFDIMDSSLGFDYKEFNLALGQIKNVRASQYSPDNTYNKQDRVVRVVLDMASDVKESELKVVEKNDRLIITPKVDKLSSIVDYRFSGRLADLNIKLKEKADYNFIYDDSAKLITVYVPKKSIDVEKDRMDINDGMVETIDFTDSGQTVRIDIKLSRSLKVEDLNKGLGDSIKIRMEREATGKPSDKLIVLDAGHGGFDGGASKNGLKEKDIALAVTKKVDGILRGKGFNTLLTREDDTFVSLGNRSKIANEADADIFVSIHANSFSGASANGIETLHNGSSKDKALAQNIQTELINETKATDRKIKHRPNLAVLRGTKMPASLVELGFISNPYEAAKMNTESYQMQLAEAIARGIENFLRAFD